MGRPLDQWNCVWMQWDCRLSTGLPLPSSRLCRLWSRKEDLQWAWNRDRKAMCDQLGLSHCSHDRLVTVRDEARLRRGHNDQSRGGHQCSKTMITGKSQVHRSTPPPPRDWARVPHDRKQTGGPVDQWNCVWMQWDFRLSTFCIFFLHYCCCFCWPAIFGCGDCMYMYCTVFYRGKSRQISHEWKIKETFKYKKNLTIHLWNPHVTVLANCCNDNFHLPALSSPREEDKISH